MLRLLLCLSAALAIAVTLLVLRQQRIDLQHECNAVHDQMLDLQTRLWRQQVQIAAATAPGALHAALQNHELNTAPSNSDPVTAAGQWQDAFADSPDPAARDWSVLAQGQ